MLITKCTVFVPAFSRVLVSGKQSMKEMVESTRMLFWQYGKSLAKETCE